MDLSVLAGCSGAGGASIGASASASTVGETVGYAPANLERWQQSGSGLPLHLLQWRHTGFVANRPMTFGLFSIDTVLDRGVQVGRLGWDDDGKG
jgi:hypothetical protein